MIRPLRRLSSISLVLAGWLAAPQLADAGPSGASASGQLSTSGASGRRSGSGYEWPELVVGGNAISFQAPFQIGAVGYLPKARFAFQYDYQLRRAHWIHIGVAALFDRGDYDNFRTDCGFDTTVVSGDVCEKGSVAGFDIFAGYSHKFFVRKYPFIVPIVRGSFGYSFWAYPKLGGGDSDRLQERVRTSAITVRPGGGVRFFLLEQLGIGGDINIPLGVSIHTDKPDGGGKDRNASFLLGFELLPLVVEYRF